MAAQPVSPPRAIDEAAGVVASIERIEAWLAIAKPGDEFVYATRLSLPANSKAASHLRGLCDDGIVDLFQRRTTMPGVRNYVARRRSSPPAQAHGARSSDRALGLDEAALQLMAMLRGLVRHGLPCPNESVIARQLDLARPSQVSSLFDALAARGDITVERDGKMGGRVVTLTSTGKRTAAFWSVRP